MAKRFADLTEQEILALAITNEEGSWEPERAGLFLFVAYVLFSVQAHDTYRSFEAIDPSQANLRTLHDSLVRSRLPVNGRVLLLHDPFPRDVWDPTFVARLTYRDNTLTVDREKTDAAYDLILDYDGSAYNAVSRSW